MKKGRTFIICGPSGVGKGTVVARLLASDPTLYFSISATTRAPRPGEEDGVHYHFLTREKFESWVAAGDFLEHAQFVGNLYGTPRLFVDQAPKAAGCCADLCGPSQLGGAGAPSHRAGHGGHGEGPFPPGTGTGGICRCQGF